jgi:hypothetical protein
MKSHRCWDRVVDPVNVWHAWREYGAGKRRRPAVARFALDAPRHVAVLARELADGSWRPGSYRLMRITDPKRRLIAAAPVRDRVVHHALHRVLSPLVDRRFIDHSYACLPGRGSHRAILRFREGLRRHRFVIQLDVRRYFYRVDRAILRDLMCRHLREAPARDLVAKILDSGAGLYADPDVASFLGWRHPGEPGRGLPIGNLTSQWWGNLYLDGLDHHVQRVLQVPMYQRYMDDLVLFADDAAALAHHREAIAAWLDEHRHLELRDPAARPRKTRGRHATLGYVVSRQGIEPGRRIRQRLRAAGAESPTGVAARARAWQFG